MIAEAWIAHILMFHLAVPEPVTLVRRDLSPIKLKAYIVRKGPGWEINYSEPAWKKEPWRRSYVIAHELCHAAYDYEQDWSTYSFEEQKRRHARVHDCADKIMWDHASGVNHVGGR